jgi:hypothetical protein
MNFFQLSRFGPGQGSRSLGMVGVYACFLALDLTVMRRLENIAILTVFRKEACLQQVLRLVAQQFASLSRGISVLDLKNSIHESATDSKNKERYVRAVDGNLIPFKQEVCRCCYSLGDSVGQVDLGGGRSVNSTFFCSRCYGNKAAAGYLSTVHKFKKEILEWNISK